MNKGKAGGDVRAVTTLRLRQERAKFNKDNNLGTVIYSLFLLLFLSKYFDMTLAFSYSCLHNNLQFHIISNFSLSFINLHEFICMGVRTGGDAGDAYVLMCGDGGNDVGALKQVRTSLSWHVHVIHQ